MTTVFNQPTKKEGSFSRLRQSKHETIRRRINSEARNKAEIDNRNAARPKAARKWKCGEGKIGEERL